jgi:peptidoglycan/xylan/chitin deacetylase (PgdA/CDA1 family)
MNTPTEDLARSGAGLKRIIKQGLAAPAVWPLVSPWLRPTCLVLAYHRIGHAGDPYPHVEVEQFRAQMRWLRRYCTPIAVTDLVAVIERDFGGRTPVLITFDDGYQDYCREAYPILREFDIPAVNFLPTHFIDHGGLFWWDAINLAGPMTRKDVVTLPWSSERIAMDDAGRAILMRRCKDRLKYVQHRELPGELQAILEALEVTLDAVPEERHVMTWDQIRTTGDLTTYGGHLHTHPIVDRIGLAELEVEIVTCRDRIAAETGRAPLTFAYPDGQVTEAAKPLLKKHGFNLAFSIRKGVVGEDVDWFEILRYPGPRVLEDLAWLVARVSGLGPWRSRGASAR